MHIGRRRSRARSRALDGFRLERADLTYLMSQAEPDVIHGHWLCEFGSAALSAQRDALITAHDSPQVLLRYYSGPYWWIRAGLSTATALRAKNLTAVAPPLAEEIRKASGRWVTPKVVVNGISSSPRDRVRRLNPARPVFATISNGFDKRKNTRTAMRSFSILRRALPDAQLMMFGSGHGVGEAGMVWASERGLTDGVDFRGQTNPVELMRALEADIDVLVHPSLWEASSISLIEAQSVGVPVIGGQSSGGVPNSLAGGRAGVLTDVTDPDALAGSMHRLISDAELYSSIVRQGQVLVRNEFSIRQNASEYLTILHDIVERRSDGKAHHAKCRRA